MTVKGARTQSNQSWFARLIAGSKGKSPQPQQRRNPKQQPDHSRTLLAQALRSKQVHQQAHKQRPTAKPSIISFQVRQGVVLLTRTSEDKLTPDFKQLPHEGGRVILAFCETGNAHAVVSPYAWLYDPPSGQNRLLRLNKPANLMHQEHAPIKLPSGVYEVAIQPLN